MHETEAVSLRLYQQKALCSYYLVKLCKIAIRMEVCILCSLVNNTARVSIVCVLTVLRCPPSMLLSYASILPVTVTQLSHVCAPFCAENLF